MEDQLNHIFSEHLQCQIEFRPVQADHDKFGDYSFDIGKTCGEEARKKYLLNTCHDENYNYQAQKLVDKMNLVLEEDHLQLESGSLSQVSHFKLKGTHICCYLRKEARIDDENKLYAKSARDYSFFSSNQHLGFEKFDGRIDLSKDFCDDKNVTGVAMESIRDIRSQNSFESKKDELEFINQTSDTSEVQCAKPIGLAKSPLREKYGVPKDCLFVPNLFTQVEMNEEICEQIQDIIEESRYVWILHTPDNARRCLSDTEEILEEEELRTCLNTMPMCDKVWSIGFVEEINDCNLIISGARIIHHSIICDIRRLTSEIITKLPKEFMKLSNISQAMVENICKGPGFAEDYIKEEIDCISKSIHTVLYKKEVSEELDILVKQGKLEFYDSPLAIKSRLSIILSLGPECISIPSSDEARTIKVISFDNLVVIYHENNDSIKVLKVIWGTHFVESARVHTSSWVKTLVKAIGLEE
ncbi:unnamed protein product [Moneuplotes crassus]|uniref:Uncharacterized protein n=1 Tax=Euplotes crassus TaxID=5936 RepID=A0AAD1UH82_EUPCR|nr:unnamed protein product [Moneuplotes crassus]